MSDKLPKQLKTTLSFTDGEVPLSTKLTALSTTVSQALSKIERAIGDLWDESYPYFENTDTLSQATTTIADTALGDSKKLEIANLARLIGPASALNPKHLMNMTDAEKEVTEDVPSGKNAFLLTYPCHTFSTLSFSETAPTAFITRKTTTDDCVDAGDYFVNILTGEVHTITPTIASTTVTYKANLLSGGDFYSDFAGYPGASFNVIPDPNQSTKCTLTGPSGGTYRLTLPTVTDQQANDNDSSVTLTAADLNYGVQLQLPIVLANMSAGDIIPSNFLVVRDDTTGRLYLNASYYYVSQTELDIGGVVLDTGHDFTVITVGANITQSIQHLQSQLFKLKRGIASTYAIKIGNITGKTGPTANTSITGAEPYVPSEAPNNHFPQYIHRDGWFGSSYDEDNINDGNGMRGDLVFLSQTRTSGSRNNNDDDSYAVVFGKYADGIELYRTGTGTLSRLFLNNKLAGTNFSLETPQAISATEGFACGNTGASLYGPIKFIVIQDTDTLSSGSIGIDLSIYLTGKIYLGATGCINSEWSDLWASPGSPGNSGGGFTEQCQLLYNDTSYILTWIVDTVNPIWINGNNYSYKVIVYYMEP